MTKSAKTDHFQRKFLSPKYLPFWMGIFMMRLLVLLPLRWQLLLGKWLGLLCYKLLKSRRHTAEVNISLCFPTLSPLEQKKLVKNIFINAGIGIFESLCAWWRPNVFKNKVSIDGLEHLQLAQNNGNSVLLYGGHYTVLDLGGLLCSFFFKADIVYRPQNSEFLEWLVHRGRSSIFNAQIGFKDIRGIAASLKSGKVLWYTPDQDFGLKHGVMSEFFGVPAATITAGRRLAKIGQTEVMAVHFYRTTTLTQAPHYHITITPKLDNYPSADEVADAYRVNQLLESLIQKDISQYMWFHRRFKNQPDGRDFYQRKSEH